MAHKVIVPQKKNYVPQFLKQRDINIYFAYIILQIKIGLFHEKKGAKFARLQIIKSTRTE